MNAHPVLSCYIHTPAFLYVISGAIVLGLMIFLGRYGKRSSTITWLRTFFFFSAMFNLSYSLMRCSQTDSQFQLSLVFFGLSNALMIPILLAFTAHFVNKAEILSRLWVRLALVGLGSVLLYIMWQTNLYYYHDLVHTTFQFGNHLAGVATTYGQLVGLVILIGYVAPIVIVSRYYTRLEDPLKRKEVRLVIIALGTLVLPSTLIESVGPTIFHVPSFPSTPFSTAIAASLLTYAIIRYGLHVFSLDNVTGNVLQVMPGGLLILDHTNTIQYVNAGAASLLGYNTAQLTGTSVKKIFPSPEAYGLFQTKISSPSQAHGQAINGVEAEFAAKDHSGIAVSLNAVSVYSGQELINRVISFTDISILKRAQAELRSEKAGVERKVRQRTKELQAERARLESSIESMPLGFALLDHDSRIVVRNASISRILHYPKDWQFTDLASDFDGAINLKEACAKVRETNKTVSFASVTFGAAILRVLLTPVWDGQAVIGTVILLEDITEAKVLERSKDEFFSIASHELRTPLTAIKGNASMMLDFYPNSFKDKGLHEMVDDIHTSSIRLIEIVNDFLDTSRLEQGKIQFKPHAFGLDTIIEQVSYEMTPVLKQKNLAFVTDDTIKSLGHLPQVYADPDRTKQIVYNLVGNAAKFTEDGSITIAARVEGKFLHVTVRDTGRGIPLDMQKFLFHKFQQAGDSLLTRDTTRGTGLGLYISKLLVQGMGGEINLEESVPGKGTSFFFTLPIASADTVAAGTKAAAAAAVVTNVESGVAQASNKAPKTTKRAGRILIFEDDPYVQRMYQRLFAFGNYAIEIMNDGEDGLDKIKAYKPQVILLDIMMPKVNGLELLRSIKSDPATKKIPILMLTNVGEADTIAQAKELGVSDYLVKADFTPEQLLSQIDKHL